MPRHDNPSLTAARKGAGVCWKCGKPKHASYAKCSECCKKDAMSARRYRAKLYQRGFCTRRCGRFRKPNSHLCTECTEKHARWTMKRSHQIKREVIAHYGGQCKCCRERRLSMLTIDHINDNGYQHRKQLGMQGGTRFYRWIKRQGFPADLQVLCANCNLSKEINGGKCEHELERELLQSAEQTVTKVLS